MMPRGKLAMKLIENPKKRRATYKNRRDGLVQKTSQLATLCGVDVLLVCFDPVKPADNPGQGAAAAATTWPAGREDVLRLIDKYRETPADKVRQASTAATYYQEELTKQQRKLLKVEQCGPETLTLPPGCRLADLPLADLGALLATLDEALRKAQRRIVELGGRVDDGDVMMPSASAAAATAMVTAPAPPHAVAMPMPMPVPPLADRNSFDLAFGMPGAAGSMVTQYCYPPHEHGMLPQPPAPIQPPCLAYHQMPPPLPCYTFQMPPPPTLIAPLDLGTMDLTPSATSFPNDGGATVAGFYDDFFFPGFDATGGAGVYIDDYVAGGQSFAAGGHAGAAYQHEHHMPAAGVWPATARPRAVNMLDGSPAHMDAAAFLERNDLAGLPDDSSSSTSVSFQGRFQKE